MKLYHPEFTSGNSATSCSLALEYLNVRGTVLLLLKLAACYALSPCPRCAIPSFSFLLCLDRFKPKSPTPEEECIESLGYLLYRKRHEKSEDSKETDKTRPVLPNRSGTLTEEVTVQSWAACVNPEQGEWHLCSHKCQELPNGSSLQLSLFPNTAGQPVHS